MKNVLENTVKIQGFLQVALFTFLASNMLQIEVTQNIAVRKDYTMKLKTNGAMRLSSYTVH